MRRWASGVVHGGVVCHDLAWSGMVRGFLLVGAILRLIYLPRSGKVQTVAGFAPQPSLSLFQPLESRLRPVEGWDCRCTRWGSCLENWFAACVSQKSTSFCSSSVMRLSCRASFSSFFRNMFSEVQHTRHVNFWRMVFAGYGGRFATRKATCK